MSSFTETWTAADSDNPSADQPWTETFGTGWKIISNTLRLNTNDASGDLRCETALATANHSVQAEALTTSIAQAKNFYLLVRYSGSEQTCYYAGVNMGAGTWSVGKVVGGSTTVLASGSGLSFSTSTTYTLYLSAFANELIFKLDGVRLATMPDTSISSGTKIGVSGFKEGNIGHMQFDNLTAEDMSFSGNWQLLGARQGLANMGGLHG